MTDKITLLPVSNPQNLTSLQSTINSNNAVIEAAFNNNLSRDGTSPNQMLNNLDMNSNQILNLPAPASANSPARLVDVNSTVPINVPPLGTSGAVIGLLNTGWTQSGNNTWTGTNTFNNSVTFGGSVTLPNNSVSNAKLSQAPANTIKGNNTTSTASVADLTVVQTLQMLGCFNNNVINKTSNYTVQTTDTGMFVLTGASQFTLTLNAATGYPTNFCIAVTNQDTRGKTIACNGLTNFILWPGQTCLIFNCGTTWGVNRPNRWIKTGIQLFVDQTGSNANDGLVAGSSAFLTIGGAVAALYSQMDCANSTPQININAGTYGETVILQGQLTGYNVLFLVGSAPSAVVWRPLSGSCLTIADNAEVEIQNIKLDNTGGTSGQSGISVHQTGVLDILSGCEFGNFGGGNHMQLDGAGGSLNLPASYTVSGSATNHIQNAAGSGVTMAGGGVVTILNTPTIGNWYFGAGSGSRFGLSPATTTYSGGITAGCQKYAINLLASLGLSGNVFPGSVAGSATNGAVVTA